MNDDVVLFQVASMDGSHLWNYVRALYNLIFNSIAYKRFKCISNVRTTGVGFLGC